MEDFHKISIDSFMLSALRIWDPKPLQYAYHLPSLSGPFVPPVKSETILPVLVGICYNFLKLPGNLLLLRELLLPPAVHLRNYFLREHGNGTLLKATDEAMEKVEV